MDILERIRKKLSRCPEIVCKIEDGYSLTISTSSENGFEIVVIVDSRNYFTVHFDGWHEPFTKEEDVLNCVCFGLTNQCRLKVVKRGRMECSWTLEYKDGDKWCEDATTGLLFVPFWRKKIIEYRQNNITPLYG